MASQAVLPQAVDKDLNNSTTTTLASGATYTGTKTLNAYPDVMVSCFSDTDGTLYFDFSIDGNNWRTFPTSGFIVKSNIHEFHTAVKGQRYFRTRFVNSATTQGTFQLATYYGTYRPPNTPLNQSLALDADAILVRPTYPWLDISRGLVTGMQTIEKFGYNANIGTGFTPVCSAGVYRTPTSAVSLELLSSAAADAQNGVGARTITIEGLDANWEFQSVTTSTNATNGTTATAISGTWLRVFRAWVASSGTYATQSSGSHVGTITIRVAGGGATWANIPLVNSFPVGQSLIGAYTVPLGYTGYIFLKEVTADTGKTIDAAYFIRENADDVTTPYTGTMRVKSLKSGLSGGSGFSTGENRVPLGPFIGPTDIGFLASGASTPEVSVEFEIFLIQE